MNNESDYSSEVSSTPVQPNSAPVATVQTVATSEDTEVTITLSGTDSDSDALTYSIVTLPANGGLFQTDDGTNKSTAISSSELPASVSNSEHKVIYSPNENGSGDGHGNFTFKVNDGKDDSETATVTVNVTAVNDPPTSFSMVSPANDTNIDINDGNYSDSLTFDWTASGFSAKKLEEELYYSFSSFTYPTTIFKYTISTSETELYKSPETEFPPSDYITEQVFLASKDGTKVPMFIVQKKNLVRDGKNPTILYAYGGFNISLTPRFNISNIVWLKNGGIYAQPNLRGGGEYGEAWHEAETKLNKQNVFDDFIAAAEYLIENNYTSSDYLAISGGSNGGLLVGATITQRPDLMKVALPAVGVMDMLRYHQFTAGAGWASDYGTADDSPEMFKYLRKYSPLHAIENGTAYPATLVTTADHDDRVVPAHSFKFGHDFRRQIREQIPPSSEFRHGPGMGVF